MQEELELENLDLEEIEVKPLENLNFDWNEYAKDCPTTFRSLNTQIKTKNDKKVFCKQPYAIELFNLIESHWKESGYISLIQNGEVYDGIITQIFDDVAIVDISYRSDVMIDLSKETLEIKKGIKEGKKVSVQINAIEKDGEFIKITGSIGGAYSAKIFSQLMAQSDKMDTAYLGTVTNMIEDAGYVVEINGVNCFMPGSLAGINKLHDFASIIGQELYVVPVSYAEDRGTIVVSHRKYLQSLIPTEIESLKNQLLTDKNKELSGHITGTTKYGVFVEFNGCLTGMIYVNDLDSTALKRHVNKEIQPGEEIQFMIKQILNHKKIILTQKIETIVVENNPWNGIQEKYKMPQQITGKIKTVKDYGIFIQIEEGIVGLLHISEIPDSVDLSKLKTGNNINVIITRIDEATKRVFLVKKDFSDI